MRLYTVEEARALLPRLVPALQRLREAYLELKTLQSAARVHARGVSADGHLLADPWAGDEHGEDKLESLRREVITAARAFEQLGVEVKDPERGLIDFYHDRDGEVVYLCYHLGEDDIRYWHGIEAGFAGRQPL